MTILGNKGCGQGLVSVSPNSNKECPRKFFEEGRMMPMVRLFTYAKREGMERPRWISRRLLW